MWPKIYEVCGGNIGLLRRCLAGVGINGVEEGEPPKQRPGCPSNSSATAQRHCTKPQRAAHVRCVV